MSIGFDVITPTLTWRRTRLVDDPGKCVERMNEYAGEHADLALSLDMVYHPVGAAVCDAYMRRRFDSAWHPVVVHVSSANDNNADQIQNAHAAIGIRVHKL